MVSENSLSKNGTLTSKPCEAVVLSARNTSKKHKGLVSKKNSNKQLSF